MVINIAYSCNDAYIQHTGISIISLLKTNVAINSINIYFIEKEVSPKNLIVLEEIVKSYNRNFIVISFDQLCSKLEINALGRHAETVYAKLFFSGIEGVDKIIYIDSDTIINNSLSDFWAIDLENNLIGGVQTTSVKVKKELNLSFSDKFINDGVVLINLKEFRIQNIEQKFIACIASYNGNPPVLSEGVINKVCKGKIKIIHPKYNFMSGLIAYKKNVFQKIDDFYSYKILKEANQNPVIIHFLSDFYNRPWDLNCTHPMKGSYLYYKSISPWKNNSLLDKKLSLRLRTIKFLYQYFPNTVIDFLRFLINK